MTQQHVTPYIHYLATGTDTFAYPWRIGLASDLAVYDDGVLVSAYTVTGVGNANGGNVVFTVAPTSGHTIFLRRATPYTQLTDYINNDPFGAETHEAALDKLTRELQDFEEVFSRIPQLPLTTAQALRNLVLPAPGAGKLWGWNGLGTALMLYDPTVLQTVPGRSFGSSVATLTTTDTAATLVAPALIPAGVRVVTVLYECLVSFGTSHGLTAVDLGYPGIQDHWGTSLPIVLGTVRDESAGVLEVSTATDVVVTAIDGLFDATGTCRVTVLWEMPIL